MNIAISSNQQQTMTSREIADLVESRHDDVKRSIDRLVKSGSVSQPPMADGAKAANGVVEKVYVINKRDSYVIVAQLSPSFTARLVDRWQELEAAALNGPDLSSAVVLRNMLLEYSEKVIKLESKVAADAPKVEFAETIRAMEGVCLVDKVAKTLGFGRNKFFKLLRSDGILMVSNLPYQKFLDRGYFTVVEQEPYIDTKGVEHPTFTTMVTGAGQVFLQRKYAPVMSISQAIQLIKQ